MGIPAAFRWLSTKYPAIISPVVEDQPVVLEDGTIFPVDTTRPNPNGEEFDNLYLDMNGIVHPCSHPEDRPAPQDEEEMMVEVFKYTDRVVNMVRPRKILMIAVDGVAPRAKMNQQRSRRFRAAQDAKEKAEDQQKFIELLKQQNKDKGRPKHETYETVAKKAFDSNSITPGTPFMDILAKSLRYWCSYKLNVDPAWATLKVIISDATVPGEGEHKIMEFVRSQRGSPDHDPNTRHVIYGLDADLIMLGLATHEPHFRVLREDVFFQQGNPRLCKLCGQKGHDERNCKGDARKEDSDVSVPLKPFIWLHVAVLREYLAVELEVPGLPFRFDLERAIDDWVFLCFFVGNDFLPHLPALEIRENGINTLMAIWKDNLAYMGGYVTKDGEVDLKRAQYILTGLAKQEDAIFKRRKEQEDRREAGFKRRKLQDEGRGGPSAVGETAGLPSKRGKRPPESLGPPPGVALFPISKFPSKHAPPVNHDMVMSGRAIDQINGANQSAASVLKSQIQGLLAQPAPSGAEGKLGNGKTETTDSALGKRKASVMERGSQPRTPDTKGSDTAAAPSSLGEDGPVDTVRLWEEGYADRYYEQKFHADPNDFAFRHKVGRAYVEGLAWVLQYYFQGCPSWEWYYPYHYAPFAADFVDIATMQLNFEKGRISRPFEQLMSVLPAASRHAIPEVFHDLMTNQNSDIIDFYPEDFAVDLNGKKMAWQGIALLPFIDMPRLLTAMDEKSALLSAEDEARNRVGKDVLLLSDAHPTLYDEITSRFYSKKRSVTRFTLDPQTSDGLAGEVEKMDAYHPHGSLVYPLSRNTMPDVGYDRSLSVHYAFPACAHAHKSMLLRGVDMPRPVLGPHEIDMLRSKARNAGRSHGGFGLRNSYHGGRGGRDHMHYGPGGGGPPPGQGGRGSSQHGPSWQNSWGADRHHLVPDSYGSAQGSPPSGPPPPGGAGFGIGFPPPPLPAHGYGAGGHNGYYQQRGHGSAMPAQATHSSRHSSWNPSPPGPQRNRGGSSSYAPTRTEGGRDYRGFARGYR